MFARGVALLQTMIFNRVLDTASRALDWLGTAGSNAATQLHRIRFLRNRRKLGLVASKYLLGSE
jgi:hypothetical protein